MPTPHDPERLLREKQKKILLCSGLAGEIQQVAQGITLARETVELQTRDALPDSYAQYIGPALGDMDVCVRYLTYIAENLSDLTSQSQGQLTPRLQPVEPAWQWTQLIGLVSESTPGGRRVVWECGCPEGQFVLADQAWADKVLLHLLMNALHYTEGPVRVCLQPRGEGMCLTVEDAGPGLAPELQERLFQPFLTAPARDGLRHGVGLGLFLAREYSLAMGWGFQLESGPGGTRVQLDIPAAPRQPAGRSVLRSSARSLALRAQQAGLLRTAQSGLLL